MTGSQKRVRGSSGDPIDEQALADEEQTFSDVDQSLSDSDQSAADWDQTASERDQLAADRDQQSSDLDHAARPEGAPDEHYELSRRARSQTTLERDLSSEARSESARLRQDRAEQRDAVAEWRDAAARIRDQRAELADQAAERADGNSERVLAIDLLMRAANNRERAARNRALAATHREAAARDREHAARDRQHAARDREAAAVEIATHGIDHLTNTLRRHVGLAAIQREMARTARAQEPLVIVFVDVVGLKLVNDTQGHTAGDELLRTVTHCITVHLRPYDLITRYGGDEFVCSISGQDLTGVCQRFDSITAHLAAPGAAITVGLAERRPNDTLNELIDRADAAMRATRGGG